MFFFSCNAIPLNAVLLKCISINNEEFIIRQELININGNEPTFYPYCIEFNISVVVAATILMIHMKNYVFLMFLKIFNLTSRTYEKRHIKWYEICKCKWRLDASVCNHKQRWNKDKCRCEYKELIDKGMCDKRFVWNPSNCECERDKLCDVVKYLACKHCKCRKRITDKLLEEYGENIDGNKMIYNTL